ncbi:hypothetical protein, partial [Ardenticatena maritima]
EPEPTPGQKPSENNSQEPEPTPGQKPSENNEKQYTLSTFLETHKELISKICQDPDIINSNPRRIKKFINYLRLTIALARQTQKFTPKDKKIPPIILATAYIIKEFQPDKYFEDFDEQQIQEFNHYIEKFCYLKTQPTKEHSP